MLRALDFSRQAQGLQIRTFSSGVIVDFCVYIPGVGEVGQLIDNVGQVNGTPHRFLG